MEDIILYNRDKEVFVKYSSFNVQDVYRHSNSITSYMYIDNNGRGVHQKYDYRDIIIIIKYLLENVFYYNDKTVQFDTMTITLKHSISRLMNVCIIKCEEYISKYYKIIKNEYNIKSIKDKCLKELVKYIISSLKMKLFLKNELQWNIHHYMMLHFKFAKKIGYEFIPKGFSDS